MSDARHCPACGRELPADAPAGPCPQCLLKAGFEGASRVESEQPTAAAPEPTPTGGGFVPPTPAALADLIPQIEILELLGAGGMGAVYKGRQKSLDRLVAVKILRTDVGQNGGFAERFTREAHALGRLNHPNIVAVYDSGHANGLYYFVMEYVDGTNLRRLVLDHALAPKDVLAIVPKVCEALQFAHDEGIVHRDIKPENILVDKKGRVKIADFGLAKLLGMNRLEDQLTATHQVMGTIRYMAPEQMEGAKDIDHRADIYSLGVVFYELLTGELPLGRFAPPSKKVQIDVRLDEIVLRTLEKEPEQRYQQAGEIKTEVETVVRTPGGPPPPADKPAGTPGGPLDGELTRRLIRLGADFDEIDHPYIRGVVLPFVGFLGFYVYAAVLIMIGPIMTTRMNLQELTVLGVAWGVVVFVLLNVLWLVRREIWPRPTQVPGPWTPEQTAEQLRLVARRLRTTAVLTFVGWFVLAPFCGIALLLSLVWAVVAGVILWRSARPLDRRRFPGAAPLILAMLPFSPAVMLGLPTSLGFVRMLARSEVRAVFEERGKVA
ncbi:protein kinase domain-containing protein [Fimbriiglobus ruber]|uniref:Serine/threonine protein kinase PrkC, regulator of stationary phase n=1 Tax=Fimbriiglobus ruber TaxID=1908690 RepID=A0A225D8G9_9BACT|nr:protein kinase [Fimbriiglobus ruber]OWK37851.1 Serine/threonine protein kinase PrkC, regulator of stationary phase [Fimbriiglobus ruber]